MKKGMKKGLKITLIIVGIIILLFCILVGIFVVNDFKMEDKLNLEVEEITNILEATEFDEEKLNNKLNNTVSRGDYYKVERAYKNYIRDYIKVLNNIISFYDNLEIDNILSIDNLKKDGKSYINSRLTINNNKEKLDKLKESFDSMKDKDKVLSYLDKNLNSYYVNYYNKIIGEVEQTETEKELSSYLEESSKILNNIYNIFEFLSEYKDYYEVGDDALYFKRDDLLNQYNEMLLNITNTKSNISNI